MHSVRESESNNKSKSVIVFHRWWSIETSFHNSIWVIYCMHVKYNAKSEIKSLFSTHPLVSDLPKQVHTFFKRSHISIHLFTCRERERAPHFVSLWFRFCWKYLNIHDIWNGCVFGHEGHICKVLQILASFTLVVLLLLLHVWAENTADSWIFILPSR